MTTDQNSNDLINMARIREQLSLVDLRLRKIDAEVLLAVPEPPISLSLEAAIAVTQTRDLVLFELGYEVSGTSRDQQQAFTASITMMVVYSAAEGAEIPEEELRAFGGASVLFTAHPYLRELLQSLTGRMGLPPLILDLIQSPLDAVPHKI